jgi:hypothetical protein
LIELLIVMSIMVVIAALGFLFLPNLSRNKGVPNATTQAEGWFLLTKQQALRDGAPRGVRLVQDPNDLTRAVGIQFIEQPEPYAPRGANISVSITTTPPAGYMGTWPTFPYPPGSITVATLKIDTGMGQVDKNWNDDPLNPIVKPGDYFELSEGAEVVSRILAVSGANLVLDRTIDGTHTGLSLSNGFRVIRAPRPLQGEPLVQMNKDVYIDLLNCYPCPLQLGAQVPPGPAPYGNHFTSHIPWGFSLDPVNAPNLDILFNSSGQVANAPTGQIILCVQHVDRPNDKLLIVIYTRTGKVSAVNWNDVYHPVNTPNVNPYSMAIDGKSSGL